MQRLMYAHGLSCLGCQQQLVVSNCHAEFCDQAVAEGGWKTDVADSGDGWPVDVIIPVGDCLVPAEAGGLLHFQSAAVAIDVPDQIRPRKEVALLLLVAQTTEVKFRAEGNIYLELRDVCLVVGAPDPLPAIRAAVRSW